MTARLGLVVLSVRDVARASAFYARTFGWPRQSGDDGYVELELPGGLRLGLRQSTGQTTTTELHLHQDEPPDESVFHTDPDGNLIVVTGREEPGAIAHAHRPAPAEVVPRPPEPPIAARLIVEVRTDGTRTVARGALEDAVSGVKTAIQVEGSTPLALALSLVRSLRDIPGLAGKARGLLGKGTRRRD